MRIAIWLSTLGGSPLQCGLERGLAELGHTVEDWRHYGEYDLILMFNQVAHNPSYEYPPMPRQRTPVAFIDTAEYGYFKRLPGAIGEYANAFAPGSMAHDSKSVHQQTRLRNFLYGRSFPYFIREKSRYLDWPRGYHPIDYPLYHLSVCKEPPNREEYRKRDLDLFVSWGGSHPWRLPITDALREVKCRSEINIIEHDGHERIPQAMYFRRMRAARCTVSYDGYGSGSFRMMEGLVRTVLIQGRLTIETRKPLIDGQTCIEFDVANRGEEFLGTDAADKVRECLADPDRSYEIYEAGYHHAMSYYTEKATAQYVIDTVRAHDWSQPTQFTIGVREALAA